MITLLNTLDLSFGLNSLFVAIAVILVMLVFKRINTDQYFKKEKKRKNRITATKREIEIQESKINILKSELSRLEKDV